VYADHASQSQTARQQAAGQSVKAAGDVSDGGSLINGASSNLATTVTPAVEGTFDSQPRLVPIYLPRKDERLERLT
jgi:hypothetical protein